MSNFKSYVIIDRPKNGCTARSAAAAAVFIRMGNKGPRAASIDEHKLSYFGAEPGLPIDIMQAQADKWLSTILEHVMEHPKHLEQYMTPIKMLLGTLMYWYDNGWCRDRPLTILKDPAMVVLANLASSAETYYHRHSIGDKLGSLGKRAGWSAKPRMVLQAGGGRDAQADVVSLRCCAADRRKVTRVYDSAPLAGRYCATPPPEKIARRLGNGV